MIIKKTSSSSSRTTAHNRHSIHSDNRESLPAQLLETQVLALGPNRQSLLDEVISKHPLPTNWILNSSPDDTILKELYRPNKIQRTQAHNHISSCLTDTEGDIPDDVGLGAIAFSDIGRAGCRQKLHHQAIPIQNLHRQISCHHRGSIQSRILSGKYDAQSKYTDRYLYLIFVWFSMCACCLPYFLSYFVVVHAIAGYSYCNVPRNAFQLKQPKRRRFLALFECILISKSYLFGGCQFIWVWTMLVSVIILIFPHPYNSLCAFYWLLESQPPECTYFM